MHIYGVDPELIREGGSDSIRVTLTFAEALGTAGGGKPVSVMLLPTV